MSRCLTILAAVTVLCAPAGAVPSYFDKLSDGVYVVHDDSRQWDGDYSYSITHQSAAPYQAMKVLDLSDVPQEVWDQAEGLRLSVFFMVRDYSWHDHPPAKGLDEQFEVTVNGHSHAYPTNCGAPVFVEGGQPAINWYDFELPKEEFIRGVNRVVLHKLPADRDDNYLYLGIDHTEVRGNSAVNFDGQRWRQDVLTIPGGKGEYLIRLYLISRDLGVSATWRPGSPKPLDDPARLILYAGSREGQTTPQGLRLGPGQSARVEWDPQVFDSLAALNLTAQASGPLQVAWLDAKGKAVSPARLTAPIHATQPAGRTLAPAGVELTATGDAVTVSSVSLSGGLSYHPLKTRADMCPPVSPCAAAPRPRRPFLAQVGARYVLGNTGLSCVFEVGQHLRLRSLSNAYTGCEMVRDPAQVDLFLVEVAGKRYAGSRDFRCAKVTPSGQAGLTAELTLTEPPLKATLSASMEPEGLRLGLNLTNPGPKPVDFKLAFPHLGGLTASGTPAEDYYFFPWGGGIVSDHPALIRRGYGDFEALYQVMDLFSPQRGGGLYLRTDDAEGWHKTLALRKCVSGRTEEGGDLTYVNTAPEYKWTNPFERVEGINVAYEYLRLTRGPGLGFRPADAVLAAHPGDWRVAMKDYADWAHRVWKFRPWPSRLRTIHHMIAAGWDGDALFRDGKYRTDFITPQTNCIELMSWWDWSELGPKATPLDKYKEIMGEGNYKTWEPYFVKDPVTGRMMFNNNPGDYDGYNERFGGLPAFRKAVEQYQRMGALVTLYTDPIRCDFSSKAGKAFGEKWCTVGADGKLILAYDQYTMCHDVPEYRQWVADTMRRVMRETGVDGLRLDEYGGGGYACFSKSHPHSFIETGVSQWVKDLAETTKLVRQAMDEVAPGSILTTEDAGDDYLMHYIDGCITYDLTVQATPLRPLECNLQRFFFPECKAYELDLGADPESKKMIWNAVDSFGRYFPPLMYALLKENEDVYQGPDCEPLVPTLMRYVYANRFRGGGKIMTHLYNASGHTVDGLVVATSPGVGEHLFDMLALKELSPEKTAEGQALRLYMPLDSVVCVAQLPRRLEVSGAGATLRVTAHPPKPDCRLVVCDAEAKELLSVPAAEGASDLKLPPDAKPACVKMLSGRDLVDITQAPAR